MTANDLPMLAAEHPGICEHEHSAPVLTSDRGDLSNCGVHQRDVPERPTRTSSTRTPRSQSAHCASQPFRLADRHSSGTREKKLRVKNLFASGAVLCDPRFIHSRSSSGNLVTGSESMRPRVQLPNVRHERLTKGRAAGTCASARWRGWPRRASGILVHNCSRKRGGLEAGFIAEVTDLAKRTA